jgi:gamma-glutamyltranspeptidase / glutathione hydrolase
MYLSSRREFLKRGTALLAAGNSAALGLSNLTGNAWAADASVTSDQPAALQNFATGGRQGIACLRREPAEAARDILRQGGNAVDAAVAALLALFVIEPSMTGLGGYGGSMVMYDAKSGHVQTIDSTSRAPRGFDIAKFDAKSSKHGYLAVGVPGNLAGVILAMRQHGTMPFKDVTQAAIALAENGIKVSPTLSTEFKGLVADIDPISMRAYFPNGVPATGATWVQPDLAHLLRRLGDEGPESFYNGAIAATICKHVQANGGTLAVEDLREFTATSAEPLHITYRGYDLYTPTLPSAGLTSLSTLKTLEQFDLSKFEPWSAEYYELLVGAMTLAWAERDRYFGDPEFMKVPIEKLLSEENAKANAAAIRNGDVKPTAVTAEASHTVNVVVADKDQNIVSWTATHGNDFGSHVAIEGLGLMLGHGISRFDAAKDSPNYPAPRKRPQHNMSPLVVLKDGKPVAGLGLPGGTKIVNVTTQMAINLIDFNANAEKIVSAPRLHTEGRDPIQVSATMPDAVVADLQKKGHEVQRATFIGGDANAILIDPKTGELQAAASKPADHGVLLF